MNHPDPNEPWQKQNAEIPIYSLDEVPQAGDRLTVGRQNFVVGTVALFSEPRWSPAGRQFGYFTMIPVA